jgi:LTXXQ motif family protein
MLTFINARRCLTVAVAAAALSLGVSAFAAPHGPDGHAALEQHFAHHLDKQLNELGARLEIKASQEASWQGFRAAFIDLMTPAHRAEPGKPESGVPDAATLAKKHAEMAADHAQKLAKVADATAKLQSELSPEQRLVLNEAAHRFIARHNAHGGMGMMGHPGNEHCQSGDDGGMHGGPHHGEATDGPWHHDAHNQ